MISNKALEIVANRKVSLQGTNPTRNEEYWIVAETRITVKKKRNFNLKKKKDIVHREYWCTCKSCSMQSIPRGEEPKCCFVEALKEYERRLFK